MESKKDNLVHGTFPKKPAEGVIVSETDAQNYIVKQINELQTTEKFLPPVTSVLTGLDRVSRLQIDPITPKTSKGELTMNSDDWIKLYLEKLDKEREQDRVVRDKLIEKFEQTSHKTTEELFNMRSTINDVREENQRHNHTMFITLILGFVGFIISLAGLFFGVVQLIK